MNAHPDASDVPGGTPLPSASPRNCPGDQYETGAERAVAFLLELTADWQPQWWLNVCAIWPDGGGGSPRGRSWRADELAERRDDIVRQLAGWNRQGGGCYFCPDPLQRKARPRAGAEDVAAVVMLAADIDPNVESAGGFEAARAVLWTAVEKATADGIRPAWVVDTGHGAGLFAPLAEPLNPRSGVAARAAWQARLRAQVEGAEIDRTHDAGRLMRLPGMRNWPKASKVAKGYPPNGTWASIRSHSPGAAVPTEAAEALAAESPQHRLRSGSGFVPQEQHRAPSAERLVALVSDLPNPEDLHRNGWIRGLWMIRASGTGC